MNYGFVKLQEYYTRLDDSRLYSAAVARNPCRRFTYFEEAYLKHVQKRSRSLLFKLSTDSNNLLDYRLGVHTALLRTLAERNLRLLLHSHLHP
jgi:hypothetical protein